MQLLRISDQGNRPLEEYFAWLATQQGWEPYANRMIELIRHLEKNVSAPAQWVTTTHASFYMSDEDTYFREKSNILITIDRDEYVIEYGANSIKAKTATKAGVIIARVLKR